MGQSWIGGRRRSDYYYTPAATPSPPPPPPPTPPPASSSSSAPYPPPPPYPYYSQAPACSPFPGRSYSTPYPAPAASSWWSPQPIPSNYPPFSPWLSQPPAHTPPPYVESQQTRTIKNDVNVRKETIRLVVDGESLDQYLVSFTFDAAVDGSIAIFYFAKEGKGCSFSSVYPEICKPTIIPFKKGSGQKFCQPPGSSIDLGFFELEELSNATNDIFPLVICAEADQSLLLDEQHEQTTPRAQITLAVIEKKGDDGAFQVKVISQILLADGQRYELREIFGCESRTETKVDEEDGGTDCVICMSEPRDTTVLPCRHMCMCRECAKTFRLQTNKCPICRQPVEQLMEIKMNSQ